MNHRDIVETTMVKDDECEENHTMSSIAHNTNRLPLRKLTFEEFLDWCEEDTLAEWVNGRVIFLSPDNVPHYKINEFLVQVLGIYVRDKQLGQVFASTILMRLQATSSARMPDLMFIPNARKELVRRTYIDGAADLAVEIISPESVDRDRSDKFSEYQIAGVREYWLIDPDRKTAEFFELGADRRYYPVPLCDGAFRSTVVPGFWMKPTWLWEDPMPSPIDVLRQLGVI
jgi:Uma2 family endonuclease